MSDSPNAHSEMTAAPHQVYTALLSHELRTPVTSIFAYLQLLDDDRLLNDPEKLRHYLAVVRGRAAGLVRIVSELTEFTELTTGELSTGNSSVPGTVEQVIADLTRGRDVRVELSPEAASAPVDVDRLRIVVWQVLDNAFKFGANNTDVLIQAGVTEHQVIIRITNQGPPVPEEARTRIFAPYQQAEAPNTRRRGGLGLGLTVARRSAEGAGGTLTLEAGEPTTFRLELPLREDPIAVEARALREQAERMDAQALRAVQDLRQLRALAQQNQRARDLAEVQQLRAVTDFRAAHKEALALAERLDTAYFETVSAIARAVEARDNYTGGHVERVRSHSRRIGEAAGLSGTVLRQLEFGAVLHDVGKIGISDAILQKPGSLDPEEWTFMRHHPEIGRRVLEGIGFLADALDAVGSHHERWDGAGYPDGLRGQSIPLFGRIVAVADAYDAMVTDRAYRRRMPPEMALAEIERGRGVQFDPDLAGLFLANPP